jgi:hypothetical protein
LDYFDPGYNSATNAVLDPGSGNVVQTICQQAQDVHLTYVAGSRSLIVPDPDPGLNQTSQTENIKNFQTNQGLYQTPPANGTCLYVPLANQNGTWPVPITDLDTGNVLNTPPLKPVHLQNGEFLSSRYEKVFMEDFVGGGGNGDYAPILEDGKIGNILSCPIPPSNPNP